MKRQIPSGKSYLQANNGVIAVIWKSLRSMKFPPVSDENCQRAIKTQLRRINGQILRIKNLIRGIKIMRSRYPARGDTRIVARYCGGGIGSGVWRCGSSSTSVSV